MNEIGVRRFFSRYKLSAVYQWLRLNLSLFQTQLENYDEQHLNTFALVSA